MMKSNLWQRYQDFLITSKTLGITLDVSHMKFSDTIFEEMEVPFKKAFAEMNSLEKGSIANPDENRMVGHYWLRNAALAPNREIKTAIEDNISKIKEFTARIHEGLIRSENGKRFSKILLIGIGGSALGPQLVHQALGSYQRKMDFFIFDNTDPDGMDQVLKEIGTSLSETLVLVISKSGGTRETRNGMLEAQHAFQKAGLDFSKHCVAITGDGSPLFQVAKGEGWLEIFPMWDWVGGRTSQLSAVGLLPAALEGVDIEFLLAGAAEMDALTRQPEVQHNPAAMLALMWYYAGEGRGKKDMVILPYKDRLTSLSRYLQQLIMESLGKEKNKSGEVVHQGIAVYGNKGSTDQHAYVQQLRDGLPNFFVTFLQVLKEREGELPEVEPGTTSGDYLQGFLLGTEQALYENDRESLTITLNEITATSFGALIALYERAVGFYASLVNINAYHQPGVEAGKKAAGSVLALQSKAIEYLNEHSGQFFTLDQIASPLACQDDIRVLFKLLETLSHNERGIQKRPGTTVFNGRYGVEKQIIS
ncbi:MAG: glucose-6-phosphate isomerase [SAR324 cluster bacterium]|nr:glucose-6-phosphate isomerase [SAR324 cluster bacterium]